jgi:glycosyltransferase involved in cell wall biosynthesis
MRFVFLTLGYHPDLVGGAYRYVAQVAERLAARDHTVDVICPNPSNRLAAQETRAGVQLHRFPDAEGFFWLNWRKENAAAISLLELLSKTGDKTLLLCCHGYFEPTLASWPGSSAFLFTGPWAEEYEYSRRHARRSPLKRAFHSLIARRLRNTEGAALARAQRILTISRYYERKLPRWHPRPLPPVEIVFGGVDLQFFSPAEDRETTRQQFGLARDDFAFLTVRRLDPRMGLLTLLDAFADLAPQFPRAQLRLAGDGPQRSELQERLKSSKLSGQTRLLGFVPEADLPRLYSAADCAIMPSLDLEGFGLATVESLACGTPVIGSNSGATPELLEPLGANLLFEPGSCELLAAIMRRVLKNPAELPLRGRCREYASGRFDWNNVVAALEQTGAELTGA